MSAALDLPTDLRAMVEHVAKTFSADEVGELIAYVREIEARRTGFYHMTDEEEAAVLEGIAQGERGEIVSDERRAAALKRYGL